MTPESQQSLRDQRLEVLGTLAAGLAHDLNNVLATIRSALELTREAWNSPKGPGGFDDLRLLDVMESAALRGSEMVQQLLVFARGQNGHASGQTLSADRLLRELVQMVRATFPKNIRIEWHAEKDLPPVIGDSTLIMQVLVNLCVNARDAMPNGGTLGLSVRMGDDAASVCFVVADNGPGIPVKILPRIWEPFFTTKPKGQGTGMGLAIVKRIVESQGGKVWVNTAPGGTTFFVSLRRVAEPGPHLAEIAEETFDGRGKTILLVDDEETIRGVVKMLLEKANYKVVEASSGPEAIARFHDGGISLLLTDVSMPLMTGPELAMQLREFRSDLPVVYITGHDAQSVRGGPIPSSVLQKPFDRRDLLETLKRILC